MIRLLYLLALALLLGSAFLFWLSLHIAFKHPKLLFHLLVKELQKGPKYMLIAELWPIVIMVIAAALMIAALIN